MVVEVVGVVSISEDARDGVESIGSDGWAVGGGTVAVHHGEKGGGAGGRREGADKRSEASSRSKAGAGSEAGARSEAGAEGRWIKAEMGRSRVRLRLRAGEHSRGEGTRSQGVDRVIIVTPGIRGLGRRGDGRERGQDRASGRCRSLRRGARVGSGLRGIWLVWSMMRRLARVPRGRRFVMRRRVADVGRRLERLFKGVWLEVEIGPGLSCRRTGAAWGGVMGGL
jgi:hypothetical protein